MRIAVMVNSLARRGGIAKHALRSSQELAAMGHQVAVWTLEYDRDRCHPEFARGLEVRSLRPPRPPTGQPRRILGTRMASHLWGLWQSYQDQKRLQAMMPGGYDLIHPHGNLINWGAAAYKSSHGTPIVWMCNDFWPVASHNRPVSVSATQAAVYSAKVALTSPFERIDRRAVRDIDRTVVLSEQVRLQMAGHYGISPVIVRAGVDADQQARGNRSLIRDRTGAEEGDFLLLTLCELMPRRRIEDVIRAVRILVDQGVPVRYLVAGRDSSFPDYAAYLRDEVLKHGLEGRVHFTGEVREDELAHYYRACDAFAWVADSSQSWGLAGMEAMAAGKPAIVSRANGLADVLEDGVTAVLVAPESPGEIAEAVASLADNPALAGAIGARGQSLVRGRYSWRANAEEMVRVFEQVVGGEGAGSHSELSAAVGQR